MVVLRLSRGGSRKAPFYRVVAADKRKPLKGRFLEVLGTCNPLARGKEPCLTLKMDRIEHWLQHGAQPSDRVQSLIKRYRKESETASQTIDQASEAIEAAS